MLKVSRQDGERLRAVFQVQRRFETLRIDALVQYVFRVPRFLA